MCVEAVACEGRPTTSEFYLTPTYFYGQQCSENEVTSGKLSYNIKNELSLVYTSEKKAEYMP